MLPLFGPFAVYFSFADGALGYDCHECGYQCCRGRGFGATRSELVQLTKHYPNLPMFVQPQRDPDAALVSFQNFSPNCFFLRDDGLCRVHVEHGREAKPYVCRAFPANGLQRLGVLLLVDTNFLCPLRPARSTDARVMHEDVMADLRASIEVPSQLASESVELLPEALLVHEAFLRDRPIDDDLLSRFALADVMAARWERPPQAPSAAFVAPHRAHLAALRREMISLIGLEDVLDADHPHFALEMSVMLPRLRLSLLRMRPADRSVSEWLAMLGRPLLALSVYVELIASMGSTITLGVVDQAWRYAQIFCELLAAIDRVPILDANEDSSTLTLFRTQEAAMQRFLQFVHTENRRRRLTLREVLLEIGVEDPVARVQLCQSFTREALERFRFESR